MVKWEGLIINPPNKDNAIKLIPNYCILFKNAENKEMETPGDMG